MIKGSGNRGREILLGVLYRGDKLRQTEARSLRVPKAAVPKGKGEVTDMASPVDESPGWEMSLTGPGVGIADPRSQSREVRSRWMLRESREFWERHLVRGTSKQWQRLASTSRSA